MVKQLAQDALDQAQHSAI